MRVRCDEHVVYMLYVPCIESVTWRLNVFVLNVTVLSNYVLISLFQICYKFIKQSKLYFTMPGYFFKSYSEARTTANSHFFWNNIAVAFAPRALNLTYAKCRQLQGWLTN